MRSPHTIGEACPLPGTSTFQAMFCSGPQVVGMSAPRCVPSPRGPRQLRPVFGLGIPGEHQQTNECQHRIGQAHEQVNLQ